MTFTRIGWTTILAPCSIAAYGAPAIMIAAMTICGIALPITALSGLFGNPESAPLRSIARPS